MAKLIYCTSNSFISEREIESLLYFLSYHHQFVYYLTPSAVTFLTFHKYKYDICHYLIGKHILLFLIISVSLFSASSRFHYCCCHWTRKMWACIMACSRPKFKEVFCLKPSTLQQWKVSYNISNLQCSLLWDVQYTVHSAHLYNLHWIKINVFPFTLSTFWFQQIKTLTFLWKHITLCIWHKRDQVFQMLGWRTFVLLDNFQCRLFNMHKL